MENILEIAGKNQQRAWEVIRDSKVVEIWKDAGAEINLVGSLKSGLLMKNKDIDFHVYSDPLTVTGSFSVMAVLIENPAIKRVECVNLINTDEHCVEWHAWYQDTEGDLWKFDLIHIQKGTTYDGYVEKVTERITDLLTPETRQAILQIKYDMPETEKVAGIEIYRAVLAEGIRTYSDFIRWHRAHPYQGIVDWMP